MAAAISPGDGREPERDTEGGDERWRAARRAGGAGERAGAEHLPGLDAVHAGAPTTAWTSGMPSAGGEGVEVDGVDRDRNSEREERTTAGDTNGRRDLFVASIRRWPAT